MTILLTILCVLLAALLMGQTWLLWRIVRRNNDLTFELDDRDNQELRDINAMFVLKERINKKDAELCSAYVCLEMLLNGEVSHVG